MRVNFVFEIGELVYFKTGMEESKRYPNCYPKIFQIVGRIADECPAGIKIYYKVSAHQDAVHEEELAKLEAFDPKAAVMRNLEVEASLVLKQKEIRGKIDENVKKSAERQKD